MKKSIKDVASYIAAAPAWARPALKELRQTIRKAAPKARESISYQMPYYSQNGRLGYFAAYTNHCSFHWISAQDKKMFAKDLAKQKVVGSTLQIPRGEKVPKGLIAKIIRHRLKTNQAKNR